MIPLTIFKDVSHRYSPQSFEKRRTSLKTSLKYLSVLTILFLLLSCSLLKKSEKKDKMINVEEQFQWAFAAAERGNLEEAVAGYKRVLKTEPKNAKAHVNLGIVYGRQEKWKKEIAEYKQAIKIDPQFAEAYFNLGVALNERGDLKEAVAHYQKALQIYPKYVEAHNNFGNIHFRKGNMKEAISEYQKAIEIKPDYARGYYNLGNVYGQQGKYDEAILSFKQALEINPKYAEAHYQLALNFYGKQEFKLAIEHSEEAKRLGIIGDPKFLEKLNPYR